MTSTVTQLPTRGPRCGPPRLPAIARDPLDDARELLAEFAAKQSGASDVLYADLAEDLAAGLRSLLAIASRPPAKPVLRPLVLLDVAQAEQFLAGLEERSAVLTSADPAMVAYLLGQAGRHLARMSDIVRAVTGLPR